MNGLRTKSAVFSATCSGSKQNRKSAASLTVSKKFTSIPNCPNRQPPTCEPWILIHETFRAGEWRHRNEVDCRPGRRDFSLFFLFGASPDVSFHSGILDRRRSSQ